MTRWFSIVLAAGLLGCHPVPEEPCVSWADPELTYSVEVQGQTDTPTFQKGNSDTCGDARLFVEEGDVVPMRLRPAGGSACQVFGPELSLTDLVVVDGPHFGVGVGGTQALNVVIDTQMSGCPARVGFSIVSPSTAGGAVQQSDHVLSRGVSPALTGCRPPSLTPDGCVDTWFVKVTDENGRVVTRHPPGL